MADPRLTVICHFRNEDVYLPFWLRHHTRLFDHGILIDYSSTDRSLAIIRELAPSWEIRPTRNEQFQSVAIDAEVMDIEATVPGWKMCLNVTEFILHDNLRRFVSEFEDTRPREEGLVTTGFIIQDAPDQVDVPLTDADLWEQRHFGCPDPDPGNRWCVLRSRLLHKASHGRYSPGRHSNCISSMKDPPLYLFWYGWCPLAEKMRRNKSTAPLVPASDLSLGWGSHHVLGDDEIVATWRNTYLPHCYDLLDGRWPLLNEMIARLKRLRREGRGAGEPSVRAPKLTDNSFASPRLG